MKKIIIVIFLFLISFCLYSSSVIYGNSKEYARNKLIFYKYADRITFVKEHLFTLEVDENGNFETKIDIDEVTYVFGEFGIYHAYFYLEPDQSYELVLPPFAERTPEDIFNPYFEPEKIHVGMKGLKESDLNYLIMDFDYYFDKYVELNLFEIYHEGVDYGVDTFIKDINENYKYFDNEYFKAYKKYRIAALKNIATQKKSEPAITFAYYTKSPVLYDNPAYMDLFNNIYQSYFDKYLTSEKGAMLYAVINFGHRISLLNKLLSQEPELRATQLRELVILKGLNDAFGNRNLNWHPLLLTLDSLSLSTQYDMHKIIAQNIAESVVVMAPNTVAPVFELPDVKGETKNIKDFRGKYVYLQFANTSSYSSQMEFDMMKNIYERYKDVCTFITILTDEDKESAKKLIKKKKMEWEFLFTEINSSVISLYKVDIYPLHFLIDPRGVLQLSPAPSPSENFENVFFNIIEAEKKY